MLRGKLEIRSNIKGIYVHFPQNLGPALGWAGYNKGPDSSLHENIILRHCNSK